MESKRGGKREGAGRKPKSEEFKLVEALDKHIDRDDVILKLKEGINNGDFKYLQLYMNYLYGKPKETKDITLTSEQPLFDLD
jgi:hypothetical protein